MKTSLEIPKLNLLHTWLRPVDQAVAHIKPYEVRIIGLAVPMLDRPTPTLCDMSGIPSLRDLLGPDGESYLLTFVWGMPTTHLAEANTHRRHSRGTASARAIPPATFAKNVRDFPVFPVRPGKNNPGMSSLTRMTPDEETTLRETLEYFRTVALDVHARLTAQNAHKQIVNRVLDTFSYKPQIVTVTGGAALANLLYTRMDSGADPAFRIQAVALWDQLRVALSWRSGSSGFPGLCYRPRDVYAPYVTESDDALLEAAKELVSGMPAHVPELGLRWSFENFWRFLRSYYIDCETYQCESPSHQYENPAHPLTDAHLMRLMVSTGRCGRVSTLTQEKSSIQDDMRLGIQLLTGVDVRKAPLFVRNAEGAPPQHPSPTEHQALFYDVSALTDEVTNSELNLEDHAYAGWIRQGHTAQRMCGNFAPGWIQHRKLIENESTSGARLDADWLSQRLDAMAADWHADK